MLLLNNVSTSQAQFASVANANDRDPRANSTVIFYGVNLGLEFRF
jgi:hypothetical protein